MNNVLEEAHAEIPIKSRHTIMGSVERRADKLVDLAADGDWRAVGVMLDAGQPPDICHSFLGYNPLQAATDRGHVKVIKLLLKHKANPNAISVKTKDTPLHWAAANGRVDVVKLLLKAGANRHIANGAGFVPLDLANEFHKEDVRPILAMLSYNPLVSHATQCADLLRDPPFPPEVPTIVCVTVTSVEFQWIVPPENGSVTTGYEIRWTPVSGSGVKENKATSGCLVPVFHGGTPTEPRSELTYKIEGLYTDTAYEIQVRAANVKGWSAYSTAATARTGPSRPMPPGSPFLLHCTAIAITVEWLPSYPRGDAVVGYELQWTKLSPSQIERWQVHGSRSSVSEEVWVDAVVDGSVNTVSEDMGVEVYKAGDAVDARPRMKDVWLAGYIFKVTGENMYTIRYETGEREMDVSSNSIRRRGASEGNQFKAGLEAKACILHPGSAYIMRARSHNSCGTSDWGSSSKIITTLGAPAASHIGPWTITMSWDAAMHADKYELQISQADADDAARGFATKEGRKWIPVSDEIAGNSFTVTWVSHGIRPAKHFVFRIRNHITLPKQPSQWIPWEDTELSAVIVTLDDVPDQPLPPVVVEGSVRPRDVLLQWSSPLSNGQAIIDYEIQWRTLEDKLDCTESWPGSNTSALWGSSTVTSTSLHVLGLHPGLTFAFRIRARNAVGASSWSEKDTVVQTADDVPSTPAAPCLVKKVSVGTPGRASVTMTWLEPFFNGQEIEEYSVEWMEEAWPDAVRATDWTISALRTQRHRVEGELVTGTIIGLKPGYSYSFRVRGRNVMGWSLYSPETPFHRMPDTVPDALLHAPTVLHLGATVTTLAWPPALANGQAVEKYSLQWKRLTTVVSKDGTETVTEAEWDTAADIDYIESLRCEATAVSLLPGSTYVFRVRAWNKEGWSAFSPDTPPIRNSNRPPQPPVLCIDSADSKSVTLSWLTPYCNGKPILCFDVQWKSGGDGEWIRGYEDTDGLTRPYFRNTETNEVRWTLGEEEGTWGDGDWSFVDAPDVTAEPVSKTSVPHVRGLFTKEIHDGALEVSTNVVTPYGLATVLGTPDKSPDKDPTMAKYAMYKVRFIWGAIGYIRRSDLESTDTVKANAAVLHDHYHVHEPRLVAETKRAVDAAMEFDASTKGDDTEFEEPYHIPPTSSTLAAGNWVEVSTDGTLYILNTLTNELKEAPPDWNTAVAATTPRANYCRIYDKFSGRHYYANLETKETLWTPPVEDFTEQWMIENRMKCRELSLMFPPPPMKFTGSRWRSYDDAIPCEGLPRPGDSKAACVRHTVTVTGLRPATAYRFRARSCNSIGWGAPGYTTPFIHTACDVPDEINDIRQVTSTSRTVTLRWTRPRPNMKDEGGVLEYEVQMMELESDWRQKIYESSKRAQELARMAAIEESLLPMRFDAFDKRNTLLSTASVSGLSATTKCDQAVSSVTADRLVTTLLVDGEEVGALEETIPVDEPGKLESEAAEARMLSLWNPRQWKSLSVSVIEDIYHGHCKGLSLGSNIVPSTYVKFRVRARNRLGWGPFGQDSLTYLIPPEIPAKPVRVRVKLRGDTYLVLQWDEPSNHGRPILYYEVQVRRLLEDLLSATETYHTVDFPYGSRIEACEKDVFDLMPAIEYQFRVRAFNCCGWSNWSEDLTTATARRF